MEKKQCAPSFFPLKAEKGELYLPQWIAYNLVQKEKSHGNIEQKMYPDPKPALEA